MKIDVWVGLPRSPLGDAECVHELECETYKVTGTVLECYRARFDTVPFIVVKRWDYLELSGAEGITPAPAEASPEGS